MPKKNYLQQTAKAFGTAGKLRRRIPKSSFVRFFENLEKEDRLLSPSSRYEKWTIAVRLEMTKARRWPTGLQEYDILIVAEYTSRLLRHFWEENPRFKKEPYDHWLQLKELKYRSSLEAICEKIRRRGKRDRTYIAPWYAEFLDTKSSYLYTWESGGVLRNQAIYIEPWHSQCQVAKMIASRKTSTPQ